MTTTNTNKFQSMQVLTFFKRPFLWVITSSLLSLLILNPVNLSAQVKVVEDNRIGVGTDTPDPSAKLEIHSANDPNNLNTFKGFLKPRMTYAQMFNIQNPANGLEVYVTDPDKRKTYWWDDQSQLWVTYSGGGDPSDELQTLSTNDQPGNVSISDGNTITINTNDSDADPLNELQDIYTNGQPGDISITGGSKVLLNVNDADSDPNNELQILSLNGNDLTISNGNTVTLSGGTVSGDGTKDFLPKWTSDGAHLEDSQIHDDGNRVSIGTEQPVDASENISLLLKGRLAFEFPDNTNFMESNIALGYKSGNTSQTGLNNVFIGNLAGYSNTTGEDNIFLGQYSGYNNRSGKSNIHLGKNTGRNTTTGNHNIFLGEASGFGNTDGNYNIYLGYNAGHKNTQGNRNIFFGHNAGFWNHTGSDNIFSGQAAGFSNNTGSYNIFFGKNSGSQNEGGNNNIFIGYRAGEQHNSGNNNTFIGQLSGLKNKTGKFNNYIGYLAGAGEDGNIQSGSHNNFFGYEAGYKNDTGSDNIFIGQNAGQNNTSGNYNTYIGYRTGYVNQAGEKNICIGYQAGFNETGSNRLYIANSETNSPLIYGEFDNGIVRINGSLEATGTKNFRIDHPLDPNNKDLVFASIEAPEMINMFRGNIVTDINGLARVDLPDYFQTSNTDMSYHLTCIGTFAQAIVKEKIQNNFFFIQTDQPYVEVSWQILARRDDTWARENPLVVEQLKQ